MYKSFVVSLLTLLFHLNLSAQTVGQIRGRVIDHLTKRPVAGANVIVKDTDRGASTDLEGNFLIQTMPEDIYKLEVMFVGYQTHLETDVRVIRDKTTIIEEIELYESLMETDQITVTANLFQENAQAPVSFHTYNREEIRRAPGASGDIFRAVETLPGVSTSGGEFSAFSVRGGSPKENIILVDNIPFDKISHFNGGSEEQEKQGGRFSIFAPNIIEDAQFQGGGFSSVYGGKFSSFLDLKIKEGKSVNYTVDGRYDITGWEFNYDGPIYFLPNSRVIASARRTDFTDILELTGQDNFGRPRFTDLILKTTTDINPYHKISLLGIYTPENFDREAVHVFRSENFSDNTITSLKESKSLLGLNWRYLTGDKSVLQSSFYYRNTDRNAMAGRANPGINPQSAEEIGTREILFEDNYEYELGMRSLFTIMPATDITWTSGVEVSRLSLDYSRFQNGLDTLYTFDRGDYRPDPSQKYLLRSPDMVRADLFGEKTQYAMFSEISVVPLEQMNLNLGLRYDYNEFNSNHYLAPRISMTYQLDPKVRLNFASGIYYQTPELSLVTRNSRNVSLENEKAYHLISGITYYLRDDLKLTAEGYYKSFADLIVRTNRLNEEYQNVGDGWAYGFDINLVKRFVDKFYGQVTYSFSQSKRNDQLGAGLYNSDFNQPHIFNILAGYEFDKEWSVSAKWRYATGRPKDAFIVHEDIFANPADPRYAKEITRVNGDRLPDFHTLNIRLDYRKQLGRIALVTFLDVVNVYNHLNVNEARFLERTGKEDYRGFGILPTGGVKIEF